MHKNTSKLIRRTTNQWRYYLIKSLSKINRWSIIILSSIIYYQFITIYDQISKQLIMLLLESWSNQHSLFDILLSWQEELHKYCFVLATLWFYLSVAWLLQSHLPTKPTLSNFFKAYGLSICSKFMTVYAITLLKNVKPMILTRRVQI